MHAQRASFNKLDWGEGRRFSSLSKPDWIAEADFWEREMRRVVATVVFLLLAADIYGFAQGCAVQT